MDIIKLYDDYGIDYKTEGHKHCRPGWVNTECPFCTGNPGYHLGFPLEGNVFTCWRCGKHSIPETLSALLDIPKAQTFSIIKKYSGLSVPVKPAIPFKKKKFKTPTGITKLLAAHKQYLRKRGFDPKTVENLWSIQSTTPVSKLGKIDYRFRLFIPIYWNGQLVSFQTRDVTGKDAVKYKACPKEYEIIEHKHILYRNPQLYADTKRIIVCEGVTDVWKFGINAVATFGIKYKRQQVRELAKFKQVVIVFDKDPQAQEQASQLQADLLEKNVDCVIEQVPDGYQDPGELPQKLADKFVRYILTKHYVL